MPWKMCSNSSVRVSRAFTWTLRANISTPSSSAVLQLRSIPDPFDVTYTFAVVVLSWCVMWAWNAPSNGNGSLLPYAYTLTLVGINFGFLCIRLRMSVAIRLIDAPVSIRATVSRPLIFMSH